MTPDTSQPAECPAPQVHGNPFRYCPYCDWTEPKPERHPDLAAMAAYEAFCISTADRVGAISARWDQIPPDARADWRAVADAVLIVAGRATPPSLADALRDSLRAATGRGTPDGDTQ